MDQRQAHRRGRVMVLREEGCPNNTDQWRSDRTVPWERNILNDSYHILTSSTIDYQSEPIYYHPLCDSLIQVSPQFPQNPSPDIVRPILSSQYL